MSTFPARPGIKLVDATDEELQKTLRELGTSQPGTISYEEVVQEMNRRAGHTTCGRVESVYHVDNDSDRGVGSGSHSKRSRGHHCCSKIGVRDL